MTSKGKVLDKLGEDKGFYSFFKGPMDPYISSSFIASFSNSFNKNNFHETPKR